MKQLKLFSIVLGCVAALTMTSCLKEDNTEENQKKWEEWQKEVDTERQAMIGDYNGKLYYFVSPTSKEADSLSVQWSVASDSVVVLKNVPLKQIVGTMVGTNSEALRDSIAKMGNVNLKAKLYVNYNYQSPIVMYVFPDPVVVQDVVVGGQQVDAVINFDTYETSSNNASYAKFMMSTGEMQVVLYPKEVVVGNTSKGYFSPLLSRMEWYGIRSSRPVAEGK